MNGNRLLTRLCQRAVEAAGVPEERKAQAVASCEAFIDGFLRESFPHERGTVLRLYRPKIDPSERLALRVRVVDSLNAGVPAKIIARRERVSLSWVYKMRALYSTSGT